MNHGTTKKMKRARRHAKVRSRIRGTADRPRLAVHRSNTALFAQLIDDDAATTIVAVSSRKLGSGNTVSGATKLGEEIAAQAGKKGVTSVVFDRGGFIYTGKIKAIAEGARSKGLVF